MCVDPPSNSQAGDLRGWTRSKENGEMDYLNIAKAHLDRATNIIDLVENMDPLVATGLSIASALIALVERRPIEAELCESKPRFVQVGSDDDCFDRIPVDNIALIEKHTVDGVLKINVFINSGRTYQIEGQDATAFLLWHEQHADVVRLDGTD